MSAARHQGRLFRKYVVVLVALVGGVLIASGLVELYLAYKETKRAVISVEREKAVAAAERIEQFIKEIERHIKGTTHAATDMRIDIATRVIAQQRELDFLRLLRNMPVIMELRHLDVAGKEQLRVSRFALDAAGSGEDFSQTPAFLRAKSRTPYFGPVYFRNESEPYMTIAVPSGDPAIEVTMAEVSLKAVWDVASQIRIGRLGYAYVVDSRGHLIAHPDVSLVLQMRNLSELAHVKAAREPRASASGEEAFAMITPGLDGTQALITHAAIPSLGWFVFVEQPLGEVFAPLRLAMLWGAMIVAFGLALSVLASVVLARRMVAPIRRLQEGAARVGQGELDHRIDIRTGDELEALADEFNRTAAQLEDSYQSLERKVADRTAELTRSVAELQALGKVGQAVNSTLDLDTVLSTVVAHAVEISGADAGTIYEYNEAAAVFEPRANYGVSEEMVDALRESRLGLGDTIVGKSVVQRVPMQISDVMRDGDSRLRELLLSAGIRAVLAVPLLREERVIGALSIRRRTAGEFTPSVVALLQTFASQSVLAIENARLFKQIQAASEELRTASQHKSQFLANMSHELRTPMNAIIGISEMLLEDARDLKREDECEPLERILRAAQHLLALINDILDLSKIEAGKMEVNLESFAIAPLIEDVAATIRPMAEKNGNRLQIECAPDLGFVLGDPMRVRQALLNLASNAAKFTENGTVTIAGARRSEAGQDWIALRVADTGIGMTQEQSDRLFQDFVQADSTTTRKYGGTGLGLAISRRFCRMMGGDITVTSALGRGSTFTISLPARGAEGVDEIPRDSIPAAISSGAHALHEKPVVLVIDDDQTVRELMERYLVREGFAVVTAENGLVGLARAREIQPAAITLDVIMSGIDGWTVLAALKGDPDLAAIPVVLVTIVDEKQRGYSLGATEYMIKPVDRDRLALTLRSLCGRTPGRLLLIEDDDTARAIVRQGAEREGWHVTEAGNGRVALECLGTMRPDAIVLDLMMPEMDGFEFLAELRNHPEWSEIPVIVVTALDLSEEDRRRLNGDVERVIQKSGQAREQLLSEVSSTLAAFMQRTHEPDKKRAVI